MLAKALASASASAPKVYVEDVFSTWLYTGNGSTQTITNGIDLSGKGGLVWRKNRNLTTGAASHYLHDTVRSPQSGMPTSHRLSTDTTNGQLSDTDYITSWNSDGFSFGTGNSGLSGSGNTVASWTFRKAAKFFDVVTYTGTGANRTIAHSLGSVPGTIIVKRTDTTGDWQVYHRSLANTEYLVLNTTAAKATGTTRWNSTTPTSTEFSLGTDATVNANAGTYVAYLFAHDAGGFGDSGNDSVVSCGSFIPDGSGNATVNLGWEPQWILIKDTTSADVWRMFDTMRGMPVTGSFNWLRANASDAEASSSVGPRPTATGFQAVNFSSGSTYIYIAIRRGPMKTPTDATKVFAVTTSSNASAPTITTNFPVDAVWLANRSSVTDKYGANTRLTGTSGLVTCTTAAEFTNANYKYDYQDGWGGFTSLSGHVFNAFRRAPGFFDVVAYTSPGVTPDPQVVNHNLSASPELIIVKNRSSAYNWVVWQTSLGTSNLSLDGNFAAGILTARIAGATSTTFSVGTQGQAGGISGNNYIAYLFASCPGVSKVGSYTGTGTTLNIDCGFTNGSRLVLIKRTDSTGNWYIWDTARGIVSGNDPYLLLNSTAAEVTNTDYIDPLSSGFQISSTAPAEINANGGSYIFLAVA